MATAPAPREPISMPKRLARRSLFLPSLAHVVAACVFLALLFLASDRLLGDAGTGWHIRTGESILRSRHIPRVDHFSYTHQGQTWYAWEWLYDLLLAGLHSRFKLAGVVAFSAAIVALTFALLLRMALIRSKDLLSSLIMLLLAFGASSVHLLARPHLITWLFMVLWVGLLDQAPKAKWRTLGILMVLMVVWANAHGGFLFGLLLTAVFALARFLESVFLSDSAPRNRSRDAAKWYLTACAGCFGASLLNPYGLRLYGHLYTYLGSPYLMTHIMEFASPDFHTLPARLFAILVVITAIAMASSPRRPSLLQLMLFAFSVAIGLLAVRNLPIASILLVVVGTPHLSSALRRLATSSRVAAAPQRFFAGLSRSSRRMARLELRLQGNAVVTIFIVVLCFGIAFTSASADFDSRKFPAGALRVLATSKVTSGVFAPDDWGGYLLYQDPELRVFIDDRHDFYGEPFLRKYFQVLEAQPGWSDVLNQYQVAWVLVPPNSAISQTLSGNAEWQLAHSDSTAVLFHRRLATAAATAP